MIEPNEELILHQLTGEPLVPTKPKPWPNSSQWVNIGHFSICLREVTEGVIIEAFPADNPTGERVRMMRLWNDDLEENTPCQ